MQQLTQRGFIYRDSEMRFLEDRYVAASLEFLDIYDRELKDECPNCGSDDVEHLSRVIEYLHDVLGWNAGKSRNRRIGGWAVKIFKEE